MYFALRLHPRIALTQNGLTYGFDDRQLVSAVAYLQWENIRIPFKIEVPNAIQLYVDQMRAELTSYAGFNYTNWLKFSPVLFKQ